MRNFFTLLFHELRLLLIAPSTYVAAVLFLLLMGFIYLWAIRAAALAPQEDLPSSQFFQLFWLPVCFVVPLLTMRSIAEERRLGTLETLMTTPTTALEVVISKWLAGYIFYAGLWALTLGFPLLAYDGMPAGAADARLLDPASLAGGYAFVVLTGALHVALGLFASSLTRSTLVAGMLGFSLLFVLIVSGRLLMQIPGTEGQLLALAREPVEYLQTFRHLEDFSRGVVDSRPLFLYLSNTVLVLGLTSLVVESKA